MPSTYATTRRFSVIAVLVFAVIVAIGIIWYANYTPPSCFDFKQNQDEEGADCGGKNCIPCANKIAEPTILWSRFFVLKDGFVDGAALIENPNEFLEAKEITYGFKVYDDKNVLIAVRENTTFMDPGARVLLLEPEISIQNRTPARAVLEIRKAVWGQKDPSALQIKIMQADPFLDDPFPRLSARVKNEAPEPYRNIEIGAVIWVNNQAVGVSRTIVDILNINEERDVVFTWPKPIAGVTRGELFFRQLR